MKYVLTDSDRVKGRRAYSESRDAFRMRREAEQVLLNRLLAEAAMPEWYPHQ